MRIKKLLCFLLAGMMVLSAAAAVADATISLGTIGNEECVTWSLYTATRNRTAVFTDRPGSEIRTVQLAAGSYDLIGRLPDGTELPFAIDIDGQGDSQGIFLDDNEVYLQICQAYEVDENVAAFIGVSDGASSQIRECRWIRLDDGSQVTDDSQVLGVLQRLLANGLLSQVRFSLTGGQASRYEIWLRPTRDEGTEPANGTLKLPRVTSSDKAVELQSETSLSSGPWWKLGTMDKSAGFSLWLTGDADLMFCVHQYEDGSGSKWIKPIYTADLHLEGGVRSVTLALYSPSTDDDDGWGGDIDFRLN